MNHVIFDGMNIVMRAHHIHDVRSGLKTSEGIPTGSLYGVCQTLLAWRKRHPKATFWWTWEGDQEGAGAHVERRRELWPAYKEGRAGALGDVLEVQMMFLRPLLANLGVHQVWEPGYEADDVVAWLVRGARDSAAPDLPYPEPDSTCLIVSSDRDLLQLVSDTCVVSTPDAKRMFDRDAVLEEYGVSPEQLLCYRALSGDRSDGMPGLRRVPRKVIANLTTTHAGDLESIYTNTRVDLTSYQSETLASFQPQAQINMQVMALHPPKLPRIKEGSVDEAAVARLCETLEMSSLWSSLRAFVTTPSGFQKTGDTR